LPFLSAEVNFITFRFVSFCNFQNLIAAPTASGDSRRTSQTGDHDRTERNHWGEIDVFIL
jgi:hypothetical protein